MLELIILFTGTDCTFTESTGTPKSSLFGQFQTQACVRPDNTTCRDECLTSIQDDLNCWAAVYYSTTCVLYYMTDPFLFSDSGNIDPSSHQLFIKECYTSKFHFVF